MLMGIAGRPPSSGGTGSGLEQMAALLKAAPTQEKALAARLIDLGTMLGGCSPEWTWHDDTHTTGKWHDFRIDIRFLSGPSYPMDHWQVHVTSGSVRDFRSDDTELYPRRLDSAKYLALYFMRSQLMFDMTS